MGEKHPVPEQLLECRISPPLLTQWIRVCILYKIPINSYAYGSLRSTALDPILLMNLSSLIITLTYVPRWLSDKDSPAKAEDRGDMGSIPGSRRCPREWQPTPVFLPVESHGQKSLMGYTTMGLQRVRQDWATEHLKQNLCSTFLFTSFFLMAYTQAWLSLIFKNEINDQTNKEINLFQVHCWLRSLDLDEKLTYT